MDRAATCSVNAATCSRSESSLLDFSVAAATCPGLLIVIKRRARFTASERVISPTAHSWRLMGSGTPARN